MTHLKSTVSKYSFSYSTVRRIINEDLGAIYRTLTSLSQEKNTEKNKIYRKFITQKILKYLNSDSLIISLDETNFASTGNKEKSWTILDSNINYAPKKQKNH